MNYLEKVEEFHKTFKQPVLEKFSIPEGRVRLRMNLLLEELKELDVACLEGDKTEVADAFCDLQYVLSGAILEFGLKDKFEKLFDETHRSNMSKACKTVREAQKTIDYWTSKGQPCHCAKGNGAYLVFRDSDKKILKSINYSPVDLWPILNG